MTMEWLYLIVLLWHFEGIRGQGGQHLVQLGVGCDSYSMLQPWNTSSNEAYSLVYSAKEFLNKGAGLFVIHFSSFQLPINDLVVVRGLPKSVNASLKLNQSIVAIETANKVDPVAVLVLSGQNASGAFYSRPVKGEGFEVQLYQKTTSSPRPTSSSTLECMGFLIDKYRFVDLKEAKHLEAMQQNVNISFSRSRNHTNTTHARRLFNDESICGVDESQDAACFALNGGTMKSMFTQSRPVARLSIVKNSGFNVAYCTGFLVGCEGHLLTNQHCIRNWLDAMNTHVEVLAQATSCPEGKLSTKEICDGQSSCAGQVLASSTRLVAVSETLDYALILLGSTSSESAKIAYSVGYLRLRSTGPVQDEVIFIPQYPLGHGKRIAAVSNGSPGKIDSVRGVEACGESDVGYYMDTQEGSSGSPVIAIKDFAVVALHHCGGCLNGGVSIPLLLHDLYQKKVLPRCATI